MEEESNYDNPNSIYYRRIKAADKPAEKAPEKIYLGNLKEKYRQAGDAFLTGYICLDELNNLPKEYITLRGNRKYVKIVINPFVDGPNDHGNTHSCAVDTYSLKGGEVK